MHKRKIYIVFVALAILFLMAHIVIPHHHHSGQICVATMHMADHEDCGNNSNHNSNKPGTDPVESCVLKQILIPHVKSQQDNITLKISVNPDFHGPFTAMLSASITAEALQKDSSNRFVPDYILRISSFICPTNALRAPPLS